MYAIRSYYANYIVHAFGQPLHCFDASKIKGNRVVVKTMPNETPFVTLDGVERKLADNRITSYNVCYTKLLRFTNTDTN